MKKILSTFMAAALISSVIHISDSVSAASPTVLSVRADEQFIELDTDPVLKNGTPFLPVCMIREWSGVKLHWNQKSKSVTVLTDGKRYEIKNGSKTVVAKDKQLTLDSAVYITNGRVMIPASLLEHLTGADVRWNKEMEAIMVKTHGKRPIAVADNQPDVKLFGLDEKQGVYTGLMLEVEGKRHKFNWKTPLSWKEEPYLTVQDLNQDGKPEIVVLLNQGSGTGIHAQDIHVVNPVDFGEVQVEAMEETLKKWVSTELKHEDGLLRVTIDNKVTGGNLTLRIPDHEFVDQSKIGFGAVVYHQIENNKLVVRWGGTVSFSGFIGDLKVTYGFKNGRYEAESVQFIPFDEYEQYIQK